VDRARGAGLVRRLAAEPGSRTVFVELTEAGHSGVSDAVSRLLTYEQRLVDILKPGEQEELARLLSVLLTGLAERAAAAQESGGAGAGADAGSAGPESGQDVGTQ
jgi:DNA-binding MarR family transcriptional regulator